MLNFRNTCFVGFLLIPYGDIFDSKATLTRFDIIVCLFAALVSFLTYGIDKAILLVFVLYTAVIIKKGAKKSDIILIVTTVLLLAAVVAQSL